MRKRYFRIAGISAFILLVVILAASSFIKKTGKEEGGRGDQSAGPAKQYVCSMHPQVIRDTPGDCPICGMFLIELVAHDKNSYDSTLTDVVGSVNETVIGSVRTVLPEHASLPIIIEASGIINYDPRKVRTISARFGGIIEKSLVKYQFQHISKGQKIFEIYCPDIYTEQWNYVKLIQAYPDRDDLTKEALEWLSLQGLSKGQIDSLKHAQRPDYHLAVYSPAEGYAVNRDFDPESFFYTGFSESDNPEALLAGSGAIEFNSGITVDKGTPLFKLIDVRALRVDLKLKTEYASLLRPGQKVIVTDAADPDRQYNALVSQIEPLNGTLFQTVKVYMRDDERRLLPGRQIKAKILTGNRESLWVPVTAIVDMGRRSSVFVMKDNKFSATEVKTGIRSGDKIEIISGIGTDAEIAEKALLMTDSDGFISFKQE